MVSKRPLLAASPPEGPSPSPCPPPPPPVSSLIPPPHPEPPLRTDCLALSLEVPDPFRREDQQQQQPDPSAASQQEEGDEYRAVVVGEPSSAAGFAGNSIRTAKYSVLMFLPRNLFEQFRRLSYVYFLAITVLNQLPQVAVFGRGASVLPLAFVLFVTAVKDAYEDFRRHRSDRQQNNRLAKVLLAPGAAGEFAPKKWKHIRAGDAARRHGAARHQRSLGRRARSDRES